MMCKENWLRTLEMRISWHDDILVCICRFNKRILKFPDMVQHLHNSMPHKHMGIKRYLIVAAACRVQSASGISPHTAFIRSF